MLFLVWVAHGKFIRDINTKLEQLSVSNISASYVWDICIIFVWNEWTW